MNFAYISPTLNKLVVTSLSKDCSLEQAINIEIIPRNQPLLKLEPNQVNCHDDPLGSFFDCWTFDDHTNPTKIIVDIEAAKTSWKKTLIDRRDFQLHVLDKKQMIALGRGDTTEVSRLEEMKQSLRDLPKSINMDHIKTISELTEYVPAILLAD